MIDLNFTLNKRKPEHPIYNFLQKYCRLKTISISALILIGLCLLIQFFTISIKSQIAPFPEDPSTDVLLMASVFPEAQNSSSSIYKDFKVETTDYTIKKGDTITSIAQKHNIDTQLLLLLNINVDERRLLPGTVIKIPVQNQNIQ